MHLEQAVFYYHFHSGTFSPLGSTSLIIADTVEAEQALESAIYFSDQYTITPKFSLDGGIRYSIFNYLGPKNVYTYAPGLPKQENNNTGTNYYHPRKNNKNLQWP